MAMIRVTLWNTADHFLVPGDAGQIEYEGVEHHVREVQQVGSDYILSYGLKLVPRVVTVTLEPVEKA